MTLPEAHRPALGIIPTGSGNATRRTLGIPTDLSEAALVVATGRPKRFDVGVCNGVYFNNSFAAGLDAKVTAKAVELKVTKGRSGLWLYLTALLHVLLHELGSFKMTIAFDGESPECYDTLIVAATQGPTYGGGFFINPSAIADDGLFDVCMIDPLSLPQALWRLPFVIFGKHTWMKVVHQSRHSSLSIECDTPVPAQIDGEVLLERRYEISMLSGAITCIVPAVK
jgi:YegS/Rv2252/BmrU family lipid kinase